MFLQRDGVSRLFALCFSFVSCASVASNVTDCAYCGEWQPFDRSHPGPRSEGEKLIINNSSLTLPGCKDTSIIGRYFREDDKVIFGSGKEYDLNQLVVVLELGADPECKKPFASVSKGALVEIKLRPRFWKKSEELTVTLLPRGSLDGILKHYTSESMPTPLTTKTPKPKSIGYWWAIRSGYNACDEGTPEGSFLCAQAELYIADGKLNGAWSKLLESTTTNNLREELVARQKTWLKATHKACEERASSVDWHWKLALALQISCNANKFSERTDEFRKLDACLKSGATNCTMLSKHPSPVEQLKASD